MGQVSAINVQRGNQPIRSICITLVGGDLVDVLWALNATTVRVPLYTNWRVDIAPDEAAALQQWKAHPKPTEWLLIWPEGTYLRWDTIEEIVKTKDSAVSTISIGQAKAVRRAAGVPIFRPELEVKQADAMPPRETRPNESPAGQMAICIPTLGQVSRLWMANLMQVGIPMGVTATLHVAVNMPVDEARCSLVNEVLQMNPCPKYLVFLGDDNLPAPRGIAQLHDVLEACQDISAVSGMYRLKQDPPSIVAWRDHGCVVEGRDFQPGQIITVDGTGLDFCLFRTDVLRLIPDPKFLTVETKQGSQTEDSYFWNKWRVATDTRPYLHTGCIVGHYDARTQILY